MRLLAIVQYEGTNFAGWQIQPNERTIQEEIEKVISRIFDTKVQIYGSGRTDAGVHAIGQTFHFDTPKPVENLEKLRYSFNSLLPKDIHIISLKEVDDNFHARFDVVSKLYLYSLSTGEYDVFSRNYSTQFMRKLNIKKIKEASKVFIGKHNFQNFTSKEDDKNNFVRTIYDFEIDVVGKTILFSISGTGFMKYMVRMIVGTLIEVGLDKLSVNDIKDLLDTDIRNTVPYKAPPQGLYLVNVEYASGEEA